MSGRRNGLRENGRSADRAISNETRFRLGAALNQGCFSWQDNGKDLAFAQNASISSQFTFQWESRVMVRGAMLKELANGTLRRILDCNRSLSIRILRSATRRSSSDRLVAKVLRNGGDPRWRGSANVILDFDETSVTIEIQIQTFKIARFGVRRRMVTPPDTPV